MNSHKSIALVTMLLALCGCDVRESPHVSVQGKASLEIPVNCALVEIGIFSEGEDPKKSEQKGYEISKLVTDKLKSYGISSSKIIDVEQNMAKDRYREGAKDAFHVSYKILFYDLKMLDQFRRDVVAVGANEFKVNSFLNSDIEKYKDELAVSSIKNAIERANSLISGSGQSLGKIVQIGEEEYRGIPPIIITKKMKLENFGGFRSASAEPALDPTLIPENIKIEKSINVEFELK